MRLTRKWPEGVAVATLRNIDEAVSDLFQIYSNFSVNFFAIFNRSEFMV